MKSSLLSFALGATMALTALGGPVESQTFSSEDLARRTIERRAVEAAIWGMPIVSVDAMREAFFRDAGAKYGDIVYWSKPSNWKNQTTTPNQSSLYVYFNFNTTDGPVVLDFPAAIDAGLFGTILDAWQGALVDVGPKGEDQGNGGKYLILPPGFTGDVPPGYIVVRPATFNGYGLFRAIPETQSEADVAKAIALVKKQRLYLLAQIANPPEQRFIDMADKLFDGLVRYDASFYTRLARMVNEEPVQPRDLAIMRQVRSLGIEKGKEFTSNEQTNATLKAAVEQAHAEFIRTNVETTQPYWPGTHWGLSDWVTLAAKTQFTFQTAESLDVDARAAMFFLAYAPPAKLGDATFYVVAYRDAAGASLQGGNNYKLRVPADVPAAQFWAFTVYDRNSAGFIRETKRGNLDSYDQTMKRNTDGSVDIFVGPKAPVGEEANWIPTEPGKRWFTLFRFYGPGKPLFEKTWRLNDIEKMG